MLEAAFDPLAFDLAAFDLAAEFELMVELRATSNEV
jgi:hypothetical protein